MTRTNKINTSDSIEEPQNKRGKKMKKVNQYAVAAMITVLFAATTAFATVKDAPAPVADTNNASISFTDGSVSYDGQTGWQMIGDLANHIR